MKQEEIYPLYENLDQNEYNDFINNYIHENKLDLIIKEFNAIYNGNTLNNNLYVFLKDFAHILQNKGEILTAYKLSSEIFLENNDEDEYLLSFYERLQALYYKMNSYKLSSKVTNLFELKIIDLRNQNILYNPDFDIQLKISDLRKDAYVNPLNINLLSYAKYYETLTNQLNLRLKNHVLMSIIEIKLIDFTNDKRITSDELHELFSTLNNIYESSKSKKHIFNENRSKYLLTIIHLLENNNDFIKSSKDGINLAKKTNYNFFIWKYDNLKAIYYEINNLKEEAIKSYNNAYNLMSEQGFLFLGDVDTLNTNILVINNFFNLLRSQPNIKITAYIKTLSFFNNDNNLILDKVNINEPIGNDFDINKVITINGKKRKYYLDLLS